MRHASPDLVILSAVDAAIAAAVGIAATLAPLTLLWVLGMGGRPIGVSSGRPARRCGNSAISFRCRSPFPATTSPPRASIPMPHPSCSRSLRSRSRASRRSSPPGRGAYLPGGRVGNRRDHRLTRLRGADAVIAQLRQRSGRRRAVAGDPVPVARVRDCAARGRGGHRVARSRLGIHRADSRPHRDVTPRVG